MGSEMCIRDRSLNDLSLWCETRHLDRLGSFIFGNTQQFFREADRGHTSIRNRTELKFCHQMNKTWINENKRPKILFTLAVCLVLHLAFLLEHRKIKISEPGSLLRIRLRLETQDYAQVLTNEVVSQPKLDN